jgi:hypothetical protein
MRVEAETRYARSGDVSIAYQVTGDGPFDLVHAPPFTSHVELAWTVPDNAAFIRRRPRSRERSGSTSEARACRIE